MAYPQDKQYKADFLALNPTLNTGLLNLLTNAAQAIQVLDGVGGLSSEVRIDFLRATQINPIQGLWTNTASANHLFGGYLGNTAAPLNGDCFDIDFYLPSAGTWQLFLNAPLDVDNGIVKLFIDEVQVGTLAGYDLYAAAPNYVNVITTALFASGAALILAAGQHRFKVLVDGMNVASTAYTARLHSLEIVRTA